MKQLQKQIKTVSRIFLLHLQLAKTIVNLSFCFRFYAKTVSSIIYINLWISSTEDTLHHYDLFQNFVPRCLSSSHATDLGRCHLYHSYDICLTGHWALLIYKRICNMLTLRCSFRYLKPLLLNSRLYFICKVSNC